MTMRPPTSPRSPRWLRAVLSFALGLVAVFGLATQFAAAPPQDGAPAVRRERLKWGVYQIHWSPRRYEQMLRASLAPLASTPDYVMFYRDLGRPYPRGPIDVIRKLGATPMISLELWRWHDPRHPALPDIIAGKYDAFLRQWAQDATADGGPVLLRFGFEFNGDWFGWSHEPELYVAAWRRAHAIFDEVGATNVQWVWSPNVVSVPDTRANAIERYYPGDNYVDWLSLDGYNFGDEHDRWHRWTSFAEVFRRPLRAFERLHPNKPILISEFGSAPGAPGQRGEWVRAAHAFLMGCPQVKGVIWFNYDKRREGEPNWKIDADEATLRAFNETFAAPQREAASQPAETR